MIEYNLHVLRKGNEALDFDFEKLAKENGSHACMAVKSANGAIESFPLSAACERWDGTSVAVCDHSSMYFAACVLDIAEPPLQEQGVLVLSAPSLLLAMGKGGKTLPELLELSGARRIGKCSFSLEGLPLREMAEKHGLSLLFDEASEERLSFRGRTDAFESIGVDGPLPVSAQLLALSRHGIATANAFWSKEFFITGEYKSISRYGYAANLLESLALGIDGAPSFPALDRSEYDIKAIGNMHIRDFEMSDDVQKTASTYSFYADLAACWVHVASKSRLRLELSSRDIRHKAICRRAFEEYGAALGMESYVEALVAGVPIEDLLA